MSVTRSPGTPITVGGMATPYIAGGGYQGDTDDLDALVQEAADKLGAAYPEHDVQIRFNSDRRSGGAWLVTPPDEIEGWGSTKIGVNAGHRHTRRYAVEVLRSPDWIVQDKDEHEGWDDEEGLYVAIYVAASVLHDPNEANSGTDNRRYLSRRMDDVDAAIAWCLANAHVPATPEKEGL